MLTRKLFVAAVALSAVPFATIAQAQSQGYSTSSAAEGRVWMNPFGLCWRAGGSWTPADANAECDGGAAPAPKPKPAPAPVAAKPVPPVAAPAPKPAAPPKPRAIAVTLTEPFASNSAALSPEVRARIDKDVVARLGEFAKIDLIYIEGHTDRLASQEYNQKLSERRAESVAAYLVSKGVDRNNIETMGLGKTLPVKSCPDERDRKALIECLAPNRRIVLEVKGTPR
jgi:OOP family OmpA-OmpF porin